MNGRMELARRYAMRNGGSLSNATPIVTEILQDISEIVSGLEEGEIATFNRLGNFKKVMRAEREVRNPRTEQMMRIPAKATIKFKMSPSAMKA